MTCGTVSSRNGRPDLLGPDERRLKLLIDFVAQTYPSRPWAHCRMMSEINTGFRDYKNHVPKSHTSELVSFQK
jgi:hypothetical protein